MTSHFLPIRTVCAVTLLWAGLAILQGCSEGGELTRAKAEELIRPTTDYPTEISDYFLIKGLYQQKTNAQTWKTKEDQEAADQWVQQLEEKGVGTVSWVPYERVSGPNTWVFDQVVVVLSDEEQALTRGNPRPLREGGDMNEWEMIQVVTHTVDFGGVTGIAYLNEEKSLALVEYAETYEPTVFADLDLNPRGVRNSKAISHPPEVTKEVRLRRYDDGWRIAD